MILLLIIFLPLFGSIFSIFLAHYFGTKGSIFITTINVFFSFIFSIFLFYESITLNYQYSIKLLTWIHSGIFTCDWSFFFDSLTLVILIVVTSISTLVHLYSAEYMAEDPHISRFMSYLSLFTFFMLLLVTGDNFIVMFTGWEGVGFCSYLLINFWFTRLQANKAAIKAMLVNRISDFALILGICALFNNIKSVEYASVFASIFLAQDYVTTFLNFDIHIIDLICFLFFFGAMGKSAQVFLHVWLPDAMEGPTPVSALIHAATMVTAGVFLIVRCSPIFEYSYYCLDFILIIGAITSFYASSIGLVQNDLKKIIAYSTCSQLGYMIFACGLSNYTLGIFHLSNHAFFKALLFLSAGSVIHAMADEQDIRKMGGLRRILPFTYSMFIIGSLSLIGFPFLTGFYSKDSILEVAYASHNTLGHFAYWLGTISAFFTAFYSTRLIYLTFLSETNAYKNIIKNAHDAPIKMAFPLGILAFGSIFIGYLTKDMFIGLGTDFWGNAIFVFPNNLNIIDSEFIPIFFKILPICLSILGVFIAINLYHFNLINFYKFKISYFGILLYNFLNKKWYFDKVYNEFLLQNLLNISYNITYKVIDKGFIELLGPKGLSNLIYIFSKKIIKIQTGYIFNYALIMTLGIIFLLFINFILFNYYLNIFLLFILIYLFIK